MPYKQTYQERLILFPGQGQPGTSPHCISVLEEPMSWDEPEKLFCGQSNVPFI